MQTLILDNIRCIEQGIDLLKRVDPDVYTRTCPHCFNSKIGGHMRHNIDHYASFLQGYRSGSVDFGISAARMIVVGVFLVTHCRIFDLV